MVDSTPTAQREQFSYVIRFVDIDFNKKEVCVQDYYLGFIKLQGKDSSSLETPLDQLEAAGISFTDSRSQCYDNASIMAGDFTGLPKTYTRLEFESIVCEL